MQLHDACFLCVTRYLRSANLRSPALLAPKTCGSAACQVHAADEQLGAHTHMPLHMSQLAVSSL